MEPYQTEIETIVNRISVDNFEPSVSELHNLFARYPDAIRFLIYVTMRKAIDEPHKSTLCASICRAFHKIPLFLQILMHMVQIEYSSMNTNYQTLIVRHMELMRNNVQILNLAQVIEMELNRFRGNVVSFIKFVGELFLADVIPYTLVCDYFDGLIRMCSDVSVECAAVLLVTTWERLDEKLINNGRGTVEHYFTKLMTFIEVPSGDNRLISERVKDIIKNIMKSRFMYLKRKMQLDDERLNTEKKTIEKMENDVDTSDVNTEKQFEDGNMETLLGDLKNKCLINDEITDNERTGSHINTGDTELLSNCEDSELVTNNNNTSKNKKKKRSRLKKKLFNDGYSRFYYGVTNEDDVCDDIDDIQSAANISSTIEDIMHYLIADKDLKGARDDIRILYSSTGKQELIVAELINYCIDKRTIHRRAVGELFVELVNCAFLIIDDTLNGLVTIFHKANDLILDVPYLWRNVAEILCPLFRDELLTFQHIKWRLEAAGQLKNNLCSNFICNLLDRLRHMQGEVWVLLVAWDNTQIKLGDFIQPTCIRKCIKNFDLDYLAKRPCIIDTKTKQISKPVVQTIIQNYLKLDEEKAAERIYRFCTTHIGQDEINSGGFMEALTSAICRFSFNDENGLLNDDALKRHSQIIKNYTKSNQNSYADIIKSVQTFASELSNIKEIESRIVNILHEGKVISNSAFVKWINGT